MYRRASQCGFVSSHLRSGETGGRDEQSVNESTRRAEVENQESNSFTYAQLYADCFRYLGINDPARIKKLTIAEYKAFMHGSNMRLLDERERDAILAYSTAISGAFDKNNKPLVKSAKDLFDKEKAEKELLSNYGSTQRRKVRKETVDKFKSSKEHAEAVLNKRNKE